MPEQSSKLQKALVRLYGFQALILESGCSGKAQKGKQLHCKIQAAGKIVVATIATAYRKPSRPRTEILCNFYIEGNWGRGFGRRHVLQDLDLVERKAWSFLQREALVF